MKMKSQNKWLILTTILMFLLVAFYGFIKAAQNAKEFYLYYNEVVHFTVKTETYMVFFDFIPLYAPLQY